MVLGGIKDAIDKAVDEAEDRVQGATGVDLGGSGGGKNADDVSDKNEDTSQGVTNNVKKTAGRAVDKAEDVVQKATGQDFGGSGRSDVDSTESSLSSRQSGSGSSGSESSRSKNDGGDSSGRDDLRSFRKTFSGGKSGSESVDYSQGLRRMVNQKDAADADIVSRSKKRFFENSYERALTKATGLSRDASAREWRQHFSASNFYRTQDRLDSARNTVEKLQDSIQKIKKSDARRFKLDTKPGEAGGIKTVSRSKAVDILNKDKKELKSSIDSASQNQFSRIQNIGNIQDVINADRSVITEKEAENFAENRDLSKQGASIRPLGRDIGFKVTGGAADAYNIFDTFTSGGGKSLELVGASVDQFFGNDNDQSVEQVSEEAAILQTQRIQKKGFQPVSEGIRSVSSVPGAVLTAYAGGAAFSGASKAISQVPRVGSAASSAFKAAGVAGGAYFAGKQGQQALKQAEKGKEGQAVVTAGLTATELYGFAKGASDFASRYGPRVGSTEINQKNFLRQVGEDSFEGSGGFEGESVIVNSKFQNPFTRSGLRSPIKTVSDTVSVSGRYGLKGGEDFSQAIGRYQVDTPGGSQSGRFESLSNDFKSGETESGLKYTLSDDTTRFREESRMFMDQRDVDSQTKAIVESRGRASQEEVLRKFDDVYLDTEKPVQKVELSTANKESDVFSTTENYLVRKYSDGGGVAAGSSGGQYKTAVGGDGFASTSARTQDLVTSKAESFASSQREAAASGVGVSGVPETSGGSGQQGSTAEMQVDVQQQSVQEMPSVESQVRVRPVQGARGTGQGQRTRSGQVQRGTQELETYSEGQELNSRASEIVQNEKQEFMTSTKKLVEPRQGQKPRSESRTKENQKNESVSVPGKGQSLVSENTQRFMQFQALQPIQFKQTGLQDKTMLETGLTQASTQFMARPSGFAAGLPQDSQQLPNGPSGSGKGSARIVDSSNLNTDWFSANLVEQKTGEAAVFPAQARSGGLFGVKTVQERSGRVEPDKILNSSGYSNGGVDNIW